jgi:hypothetical protein
MRYADIRKQGSLKLDWRHAMEVTANLNDKQRAVIAQLAALKPKRSTAPSGDEPTAWELRLEKIRAAAE